MAQTPAAMPGNINRAVHTPVAWFTPDNYNNGIWINRITGDGTAGNFTQPDSWTIKTPPSTTAGNFHPAVMFRPGAYNVAPHRMISDNVIGITDADAFTVIMVYKRRRSSWDFNNILNFSTGNNYADEHNVTYRAAGNDVLYAGWTTTDRELGAVPDEVMQLLTVDNNNGGTATGTSVDVPDGIIWYLGGGEKGKVRTQTGSANTRKDNDYKIVIGGSHYDLTGNGERSFTGDIQELVILKRNRTADPFLADVNRGVDFRKIHSYLAVKYGLTLSTDYVASDGTTVVWNNSANAGYNSHIFGIARDDSYGLYQKQAQSQSAGVSAFIPFTGNSVTVINSANTSGRLDNSVYAMFGSNGQDFNLNMPLTEQYTTVAGAAVKLNYRKALVYKAQITGAMKIKFKPATNIAVPKYMLVSTDPEFRPGNTEVYPFEGAIPEKSFSTGYYYISFGGYRTGDNQGPGGISDNLRLWLRADDEASITTELLPAGSGKLTAYPSAAGTPDGTLLPAVSQWKDPVRGHTYSYSAGSSNVNQHLEPVYEQSNYLTNFHPAVRFWGQGNVRSTYLSNASGILENRYPANNKHAAYFVVNNDFGDNPWVYSMMFGKEAPDWSLESYYGPGYGVEKRNSNSGNDGCANCVNSANNVAGRFRTSVTQGAGCVHLFDAGATSILGYLQTGGETQPGQCNDIPITFRFNGKEDSAFVDRGNFNMSRPSTLGAGFDDNRVLQGVMSEAIIFEDEVTPAGIAKIESYLAIKYGITLRPSNTVSNRFNYMFSNGKSFWNGEVGDDDQYARFYNRIAAVIRDDDANLHNRHSHSTNVGSILHLGIAGTRLGTHADLGNFDHDREAVVWGDDNETGVMTVPASSGVCGDFATIFKRKWMIHKVSKDNRPVSLLVGAENNEHNQLGKDGGTADLFAGLDESNEIYMIVADSEAKLTPGNPEYGQFSAVVPMNFLDGEHQCLYTFTNTVTFVTFGFKTSDSGCTKVADFDGVKVFDWSQWERSAVSPGTKSFAKGGFDLGDDIRVTGTSVVYDGSVAVPLYYPSVTGKAVANGLYIRRQSGDLDSKATVTVEFNAPVRPEFTIYDIDGYLGRLEQITVTGYCDGGAITVYPDMSYAGNPATSYYRIAGNAATAIVRYDIASSDKKGQLNVAFQAGVTKIVITYSITGVRPASAINDLIVSPLRLHGMSPAPLSNEDRLSLVKDVAYHDIIACQPVEYSFHIRNVDCEPQYVNFRDTLPEGLTWNAETGMDLFNAEENSSLKFNDYAGTRILAIDSLRIPISKEGDLILTATASFDRNFLSPGENRRFDNHSWLEYKNKQLEPRRLRSVDRETLGNETYFYATGVEPRNNATSNVVLDKEYYFEDGEIAVTVAVNNPTGEMIPDSYLDIIFDAGFRYVAGSFASSTPPGAAISGVNDNLLSVAGSADGVTGFVIPEGKSTFAFKLKAPSLSGLEPAVDNAGNPAGGIADLNLGYEFSTGATDPCIIQNMVDWGTKKAPYRQLCRDLTAKVTPAGAALCENGKVVLTASASGCPGVKYQWYRNGVPVGDSTARTLTVTAEGEYKCRVACGSVCWVETDAATVTYSGGNGVVYVTVDGANKMDGSSWDNAYRGLAAALRDAAAGTKCIKEIWVAAGTYYPEDVAGKGVDNAATTGRDKAFVLVEGVKIYGGFCENYNDETTLEDRLPYDYNCLTFLSGDLNVANDTAADAYHVVVGAGTLTGAAALDGFIITGGSGAGADPGSAIEVNGTPVSRACGGGISLSSSASPVLANLVVVDNHTERGGGIYLSRSSPEITRVKISGNSATDAGGGMYVDVNCSPMLTTSLISGNTANSRGGGMYIGHDKNRDRFLILTNVTVAGNYAAAAGGIAMNSDDNNTLRIRNSIVAGNAANDYPEVTGTAASIYYRTLVKDATLNDGIILNGNPDFNDPGYATAGNPETGGDYRLRFTSVAIDKGDKSLYDAGQTPDLHHAGGADLNNQERILGEIDLGAYEFPGLFANAGMDMVTTRVSTPVTIDVLANDDLGYYAAGVSSVAVAPGDEPAHGNVKPGKEKGVFVYTPDEGYCGIDFFTYGIEYRGDVLLTAQVYVLTHKPLSTEYFACPGARVTPGFRTIPNVYYKWFESDGTTPATALSSTDSAVTLIKNHSGNPEIYLARPYYIRDETEFPFDTVELYLSANETPQVSDIRVTLCPASSRPTVYLTGFLDSLPHASTVKWTTTTNILPAVADASTGAINTAGFPERGTFAYAYTRLSECGDKKSPPAKAYVHIPHGKIPQHRDTVTICLDQSAAINVSSIFGLDLGGSWRYDHAASNVNPDETVSGNVSTTALDALIFNGQKAYLQATQNNMYAATYRNISGKAFAFEYDCTGGTCACASGVTKRIVIMIYE
jgi:hypothetical protein